MKIVLLSLIILFANLLVYGLMALDKAAARRRRWRVPEATLLALALAGGWPALMLAMKRLRHKTAKPSFQWKLRGVVLVQVAALLVWALR